MDKRAVLTALDRSIAAAVWNEFNVLTRNEAEQAGNKLRSSARDDIFSSLGGLKRPNYDDKMVALVYAAMYQLQHINIAYSLIKDTTRNFSCMVSSGKLKVADFGAGTLAMHIGVALAVADALEEGQHIEAVHIDSMDISLPMLRVGANIWEKFKHIVSTDESGNLCWLYQACKLISYKTHNSISTIEIEEGFETWLSAIHAVYSETETDTKRDLCDIYSRLSPVAGFITSYGNHHEQYKLGNAGIATDVSPFDLNMYEPRRLSGNKDRQGDFLENTPALLRQFDNRSYHETNMEVAKLNKEWELVCVVGTQRKLNAVLYWDWDTAFFTYVKNNETNCIADIDDLPF